MANTNAPFGFRWLGKNLGGGPATFEMATHKVVYNYGTALYRGDMVQYSGAGYIEKYGTGTKGSNVAGIVHGFEYLSTALGRNVFATYLPTTDHAYDITAFVIPIAGVSPQLFVAQSHATKFTIADIGGTLEPTYSTGGTATSGVGKSGMTLTQSGVGTTATYPLRVVDLWSNWAAPGSPGTADDSYNWVVVASNPFSADGV